MVREDVRVEQDGTDSWSVIFETVDGADYLVTAFSPVDAPIQTAVSAVDEPIRTADYSSSLNADNNRADYLIVAPREFSGTAEALAAYRRGLFKYVKIVWLDDIYDEFSAGRVDPKAIGRFMKRVTTAWRVSPAIVTLIGKGSLDEMDRMSYGDSFLPVLLTSTPWELTASDDRLLGFEDNPPFAIGRLPITNNVEGVAYVDKLIDYESTIHGSNRYQAVLVADNPDRAGQFDYNSDLLAERLLDNLGFDQVTKLYHPTDSVRDTLILSETWNTDYVSYDGHGSATQVGGYWENFINASDASSLENSAYPIFTALTCSAGNDSLPATRSLAASLVLNSTGGAIASVAPTGKSLDRDAQILGNAFVDSLFGDNNSIGDAVREAKTQTNGSISEFMPRIYSVVGEPAIFAR